MKLENKTVNFLGDSITEGVGVFDIDNKRYDRRLLKDCGLKAVNNYGISGTRFAHQSKPSENPREELLFCGRIFDMEKDADIIIVFGATNDYGHGDAPLGDKSDKTPATFYGAVDFMMSNLKSIYPDSTILFITPARRVGDESASEDLRKGNEKLPLKQYVDVIKEKGEEHKVYVLDFYDGLGINLNNEYERNVYAPDGLHFNDLGHEIISKKIAEFLYSI